MIFETFNKWTQVSMISALVLLSSTLAFGQSDPVKVTGTSDAPADKYTAVKLNKDGSTAVVDNTAQRTTNLKLPELNADRRSLPTKAPAASSGWEFAFAPYLYMTGISGTVGARGRTTNIKLSFGDVISHFKFGMMGTFEAKKGKLLVVNDFVWVKMSEDRDTPGGLYSTAKIGVNLFTWTPELGYRLYESDGGSFDVLGGVRITSVENTLKFGTGILPAFDVNARKTWAAPIIGGHGLVNVTPKFYLSTFFDVGGGFGTHFTGQFYGGAGYRITPKVALVGGYRYLNNNFSDSEGFLFDAAMNGIVVGAKFSF